MAEIDSSYGDSLFYNKQNAIKSFNRYLKPQNYTLLKKGNRYLVTTNKRTNSFRKDGWVKKCRGTVKGKGFDAIKTPIICSR